MDLLTREQACALAGLSFRTYQRKRQHGEFPDPVRIGTHEVRHPRDTVERWLAQHRIAQPAKK